jgi:acyl carrier protein
VSELTADRSEEPHTLVAQGTQATATDSTNKHEKVLNKPQRIALQPLTDSTMPSDQQDRITREHQSQPSVVLPSVSQSFSQSGTNGVVAIGTSLTPEVNPMATANKKEALPATAGSAQDTTTGDIGTRRDSGLPLSASASPMATTSTLEEKLVRSLAKVLYMEESDIDVEKPFTEIGLDSVIGVEWIDSLNKQYGINLKATRIYDYPTVRQMAGFLQKELLQRGEEMQQTAGQLVSILSLDDILEKVKEGVLSIDVAENVLLDMGLSY